MLRTPKQAGAYAFSGTSLNIALAVFALLAIGAASLYLRSSQPPPTAAPVGTASADVTGNVVPVPDRLGTSGALLDREGRALALSGKIRGWVDIESQQADGVLIQGWAVDRSTGAAAPSVFVLIDGKVFAKGVPREPRQDVAEALRLPGARNSGFGLIVTLDRVSAPNLRVRVFALDKDGAAGELEYAKTLPYRHD
jgi:hypothetical protein